MAWFNVTVEVSIEAGSDDEVHDRLRSVFQGDQSCVYEIVQVEEEEE